jgi:hypothetical protein
LKARLDHSSLDLAKVTKTLVKSRIFKQNEENFYCAHMLSLKTSLVRASRDTPWLKDE